MNHSEIQRERYESFVEKQFEDPEFLTAYAEDLSQMNLAVEIANLRQERGLSQSQVATRAKMSPSVISRLEKGENVELKSLLKVLRVLNGTLKIERG